MVPSGVFHRILVPTDGSANATTAARLALDLAAANKAEVIALYIVSVRALAGAESVPLPPLVEQRFQEGHTHLEALAELGRQRGISVRPCVKEEYGWVPDAIIRTARNERSDLIVMGSRGLTGLKRLLLGSVAYAVISRAPCPVLVVREPIEEAHGDNPRQAARAS